MSKPEASAVYVDKLLTNLSKGYKNKGMIYDLISPEVPVSQLSGKYTIFGKEAMLPQDDLIRPGDPAPEIRWGVTYGSYSVEKHGHSQKVPRVISQAADRPINVLQRSAEMVKDVVTLNKEIRLRDLLLAGCSGVTLNANQRWSNYTDTTNSKPFIHISTGKEAVRTGLTMAPTHIIIPPAVAEALSLHPDMEERKYVMSLVEDHAIPNRISGMQVIIPQAISVADEAGTTNTDVWGNDVYIIYVNPRPGLNSLTTLATFAYNSGEVSRWYDDKTECDYVRYTEILSEALIDSAGCYIIKDVIA